jgi:hypothetical protein
MELNKHPSNTTGGPRDAATRNVANFFFRQNACRALLPPIKLQLYDSLEYGKYFTQ